MIQFPSSIPSWDSQLSHQHDLHEHHHHHLVETSWEGSWISGGKLDVEREVGTPERKVGSLEREVGSPDAMDFQILTFIFLCKFFISRGQIKYFWLTRCSKTGGNVIDVCMILIVTISNWGILIVFLNHHHCYHFQNHHISRKWSFLFDFCVFFFLSVFIELLDALWLGASRQGLECEELYKHQKDHLKNILWDSEWRKDRMSRLCTDKEF